jgi:hypothetical protein
VFGSLICNVIGLLRISNTVTSVCFEVARNPLPRNAILSYRSPNPSFPHQNQIDTEISGLSSLFPDDRRQAPLGTAVERTWAPTTTGTSVPPPLASPLRSPLATCPLPRWRPATGELFLGPWVSRSLRSSLVSLRRRDLVSGCLLCFPSNRSRGGSLGRDLARW